MRLDNGQTESDEHDSTERGELGRTSDTERLTEHEMTNDQSFKRLRVDLSSRYE